MTRHKSRGFGYSIEGGANRAFTLFLISPDKTLFFSAIQNMPFARPRFADLIEGFEFMFAKGYTNGYSDRPT